METPSFDRSSRRELVRPVDVRRRARGCDLDLVAARRHPLGHLSAVLLGAARNRLAVALYDVEQTRITRPRAARRRCRGRAARPRARRLVGDRAAISSARTACDAVSSASTSPINAGPCASGSNRAASPTVSGIAAHARATIGLLEASSLRSAECRNPRVRSRSQPRSRPRNIAARSGSSTGPTTCTSTSQLADLLRAARA